MLIEWLISRYKFLLILNFLNLYHKPFNHFLCSYTYTNLIMNFTFVLKVTRIFSMNNTLNHESSQLYKLSYYLYRELVCSLYRK